jgi:hypothetical protein
MVAYFVKFFLYFLLCPISVIIRHLMLDIWLSKCADYSREGNGKLYLIVKDTKAYKL